VSKLRVIGQKNYKGGGRQTPPKACLGIKDFIF